MVIVFVVVAMMNAHGQDFGIKVKDYYDVQVDRETGVTDTLGYVQVYYMYTRWTDKEAKYSYRIKNFNMDGKMISQRDVSEKVPLDFIVQGKTVLKWTQELMTKQDSIIQYELAKRLAIAKRTGLTK